MNNHNSLPLNNPVSQTNVSAAPNSGIRKGPLIHHPSIPDSHHNYTSGAGHHHAENTPPAYNRANSTQNSKRLFSFQQNDFISKSNLFITKQIHPHLTLSTPIKGQSITINH